MAGSLKLACCLLVAYLAFASSTRTGDEDFAADTPGSGSFYVFADKVVHILTPSNLTIVKNLTTDSNGQPLTNSGAAGAGTNTTRTWNDGAYVEDAEKQLRYVIMNEGDVYSEGDTTQYSYVSVIDAVAQKFAARIKVGPRPVHLYTINGTDSVWSHSDADGYFYVIPVTNPKNLTVATKVPSFVNKPAHGKLVVNTALYPIAYGTNVAEAILPKFNLSNNTRIRSVQYNTSLPNPSICTGTHTIVYSRVNRHLFIECVDGAGVLEWNTVNDTFVRLHTTVVGVVTGSPADDIIFVGNNEGSNATLLRPGETGRPSTVYALLQVPYNPDYPAFYRNASNELQPGNFTDYTIFFPLTRNTNLNNIRAAGTNVTTAAYSEMPSDCQYMNSSSVMAASVGDGMSSGAGLMLAAASNGSSLTPQCGACAPGINSSDPSQFNASLSGFGVLDLSTFSSGPQNVSTTLTPAGAILPQLDQSTGANQCSFKGELHRTVRRGGAYIATVADLPQPSVYLVEGASPSEVYGRVNTAKTPSKLMWVPSNTQS